jgi:hydroxymethylpyrimidine pyrophosphatase-like HAD family hydrolase
VTWRSSARVATRPELLRLRGQAEGLGVHLVWSNVHVHLAEAVPDKGLALLQLLRERGVDPAQVVTIGDAPNDAGLFTRGRFGLTVGTADVLQAVAVLPELAAGGDRGGGGRRFRRAGDAVAGRARRP